jgi:hypothetical protein
MPILTIQMTRAENLQAMTAVRNETVHLTKDAAVMKRRRHDVGTVEEKTDIVIVIVTETVTITDLLSLAEIDVYKYVQHILIQ